MTGKYVHIVDKGKLIGVGWCDKMKYKLEGKVLEKEKKIERLLNLPMNEFEQEITKCTKEELYEIVYRAFEVLGRIERVKIISIGKNIGREITLRLD